MTAEATTANEATSRLLRRLAKGLERRRTVEGAARVEVDRQLLEHLDELVRHERRPPAEVLTDPPPRAVAVAMATAIFVQPHLGVLIGDDQPVATEEIGPVPGHRPDPPWVIAPELLQDALGLPNWELEDIREEVDRRVGAVLKQARALRWLWGHFGLPESSADPLFRVLFPGAPGRSAHAGLVRRGAHLYAMTSQDAKPPLEALYLPWLPVDEDKAFHPLRTFKASDVNQNLRRALCRAIGASDDEIVSLLDRMVTIVPRGSAHQFLANDGWRSRGLADIVGLPAPYGEASWIVRPVEPDELGWGAWLRVREGGRIEVVEAKAAFDVLALPRVNEMLRQLYAQLFARLLLEDPSVPTPASPADLVLFDVERHVRAVLQPLLDWAGSPRTAAYLSAQIGADGDTVAALLGKVRAEWGEHLEAAWLGGPAEGSPARSAQALITHHLVVTQDALRHVLRRRADPRAPHRDVAMLFAGAMFSHAPLERLWADTSEAVTWPNTKPFTSDVIGQWFWGTWQRVLDRVDDEVTQP